MRRNKSDLYFLDNNRYMERERNEENRYYLKNPIDYYHGEEISDGYRHYSPDSNDYERSRYGDYIYNYYLNSPMRSDISEDWRFPPIYQYKPYKN